MTVVGPEHGACIMLVEDHQEIRDLLVMALHRARFHLIAPDTPTAAIDIIADLSVPVDLLLTDIVMPEMNGVELAERAVGLRLRLRVGLMSGYAERALDQAFLDRTGWHFIAKPFDLTDFVGFARMCLGV